MKHLEDNATVQTDLATYLVSLSLRLRVAAMALEGLARREGRPGETQYDEITETGSSLERIAECLRMVSDRLCPVCRLAEVEETVSLAHSNAPSPGMRPAAKEYRLPRKARRAREPGPPSWGDPPTPEPYPVEA